MNLPPDHVSVWIQLPNECDARIQLKLTPEVTGKWGFFCTGLIVMLWGFPGFRRAMIKKFEKRK